MQAARQAWIAEKRSGAEGRLAWIKQRIAAGQSVVVRTQTGSTPWSPATWAKFEARGIAPFKVSRDGDLLMYARHPSGPARYEVVPPSVRIDAFSPRWVFASNHMN